MVGGCLVRLVARIPASLGRVESVMVRVEYVGTASSDGADVTDLQLQPGEASGIVPNSADLRSLAGPRQWRNGVVPRSADEVIVLANSDRAAPVRVDVTPSAAGQVRVGSFRFGRVAVPVWGDAETSTAPTGWGRPPVLTERSDGHLQVLTEQPLHMTVGWSDRS